MSSLEQLDPARLVAEVEHLGGPSGVVGALDHHCQEGGEHGDRLKHVGPDHSLDAPLNYRTK